MPLSPSDTKRTPIHERAIRCEGFEREDGLWDIEGHMTDIKTYGFDNDWRGRIESGEPLHDMWLRLTIDDDMEVHHVEAHIDASPFSTCPHIAKNFQRLIGLRIAPGWTRNVRRELGGIQGCTHLVDLLGPMATTAFQMITPIKAQRNGQAPMPSTEDGSDKRPSLINSCHGFSDKGDVVKNRWPEWYRGD